MRAYEEEEEKEEVVKKKKKKRRRRRRKEGRKEEKCGENGPQITSTINAKNVKARQEEEICKMEFLVHWNIGRF